MQFVINEMRNLISVFPNIIMNSVNNQKISIPKPWGLSRQHITDIQTIVKKYYTDIDKFMKEKESSVLTDVVSGVMKQTNEWFQFALNTPLFARVLKSGENAAKPMESGVMEMEVEEFEEEIVMEGEQQGLGLLSGLFGTASAASSSKRDKQSRREEAEGQGEGSARRYRKRDEPEAEVGGTYSIFNDNLVRRLFTHYFLNVVLKYVKLAKTVVVLTEEERLPEEDETALISVLEAQDQQNGVVRRDRNLMVKQRVINLVFAPIACELASSAELLELGNFIVCGIDRRQAGEFRLNGHSGAHDLNRVAF
jgi:hypothetical protein